MGSIKNRFTFINIIKVIVRLILVITTISVFFLIISPLFPTPEQYKGSFPERFHENFGNWVYQILPKRLVLFRETYNILWVLTFLSNVFLLLLLRNIWKAVDNYERWKSKELIKNYFNWAVSSLLIAIIFVTKSIGGRGQNVLQVGLGILSLTASIFILLYYRSRIDKG